jgi:hypothetical protein
MKWARPSKCISIIIEVGTRTDLYDATRGKGWNGQELDRTDCL